LRIYALAFTFIKGLAKRSKLSIYQTIVLTIGENLHVVY